MFRKFAIIIGYGIPVAVMLTLGGMLVVERVVPPENRAWALCKLGIEIDTDACLSERAQQQLEREGQFQIWREQQRQGLQQREIEMEAALEQRRKQMEEELGEAREAAARIAELRTLEEQLSQVNTFEGVRDTQTNAEVSTGIKWRSLLDQTILSQWCTVQFGNSDGVAIRIYLADANSNGVETLRNPHRASLREAGISNSDFRRLQGLCRFRRA